jgi:hypothetical protein
MTHFVLHMHGKPRIEVEATSPLQAVVNADVLRDVSNLYAMDVDGEHQQIAGQAPCGCVYHAEEGMSCVHDLARVGIELFQQRVA